MNVLRHPKFLVGNVDTYFIDGNPQLFNFSPTQNRAQKLLYYLGNLIVNGPQTPLATKLLPASIVPYIPSVPSESCCLFLLSDFNKCVYPVI